MSTALHLSTAPTEPAVAASHVHDAITRALIAERNLKSAVARGDNAIRMLNLAVQAGKVLNTFIHEGCLTVVMSTGAVRQLQSTVRTTPASTEFGSAWVDLPSVPGTAAAYLDQATASDVTDIGGMACIADDEQVSA